MKLVPSILILSIVLTLGLAPKKRTHAVSIDDMSFKPDKLEIQVGDTVEWTNNDDRDHTVKAKDDTFASGKLGSGATFKFTFKKAGKYPYSCSLHPRMKGTVVVSQD